MKTFPSTLCAAFLLIFSIVGQAGLAEVDAASGSAEEVQDDNILVGVRQSRGYKANNKIANATGIAGNFKTVPPPQKRPGETGLTSLSKEENEARVAQIAEITGTAPILAEVRTLQGKIKAAGGDAAANEALVNRLIYQRGKLVQFLQTASFEVNAVKAEVELAIAKIDDARARIVEKRARVLKRNSMINFVSGGVTKIVGYSIALGSVDLPTNLLEIVDGGIQSSLSGLAVKEQEDEKHFSQTIPTLLTTIIDDDNGTTHDYPEGVWRYLTSRAFTGEAIITESTRNHGGDTTGGDTRRSKLINAWTTSGMLGDAKHFKGKDLPPAGKVSQGKTINAQLLEDRAAMLSDLKSVVAQMNNNLMQLSQVVKDSYLQDPAI